MVSIFTSRRPIVWLIAGLIGGALLYGGTLAARHEAKALKRDLQQHFANIHEFLEPDNAGTPFGDGRIDQGQLDARDSVTLPIATSAQQIPWDILAKASLAERNGVLQPDFGEAVKALDHRTLRAKGYMFPLDQSEKQSHFLLCPYPPSCPFCLPAGPSELIEIRLDKPVAFTYEPLVVEGRFELLAGDAVKDGMFYRMSDAAKVEK